MTMHKHFLDTPASAGLYRLPAAGRNALAAMLAGRPGTALTADLGGLKSVRGVLRRLGRDLALPEWYGANYDALADCLGDPQCPAGRCPVLVLDGLDALRHADVDGFATLLEVLRAAVDERRAAGRSLWILIDAAEAGLPTPPEA